MPGRAPAAWVHCVPRLSQRLPGRCPGLRAAKMAGTGDLARTERGPGGEGQAGGWRSRTRALRRRSMDVHGRTGCEAGAPRTPAEGTDKMACRPRKTTPDAAWHLPGSHSSGPAYAGHSPLQRATARPTCGPKPFIGRRPGPPAGRSPLSRDGPARLRAEALHRAKARPADLSAVVPPDEGG